ncbi:hypothetical protein PVAP13_7NG398400 [Panicum virgatum]|uniref:Uncharacterized protein n=1 Tax=Panicum virgatum TaxID=38727 RepID=A0A8T0Q668_PANVG|nr:hypothetical protein PVAP13_7NG398400 [Panicum virgatum]
MAAASRTPLLRSVFTKMARRPGPGPGPASSSSRRFSSSPTGVSTPPATNNSKDATRNKIEPCELERTLEVLAFESAMYLSFVFLRKKKTD